MIKKIIHCPLYNCRVFFVHGPADKAVKWLNSKLIIDNDIDFAGKAGECYRLRASNGGAVFYLYIAEPFDVGTLVHETNHLATLILEDRGVEDCEANAYYQEYWFNLLSTLICTKQGKRKTRQSKRR